MRFRNAFGQTREAEDVPFFPPCLLLIDQNAADVDSSSSMRLFLHPLFSLPVLHSAVTFEMCCPYALPTSLRLPMLSVLFLVGARVSVGKRLNLSDTVALCAMLATVHVLSPNVTHSAFEFNDDEKRDQVWSILRVVFEISRILYSCSDTIFRLGPTEHVALGSQQADVDVSIRLK